MWDSGSNGAGGEGDPATAVAEEEDDERADDVER